MKKVKWIGSDGGWKTGVVVEALNFPTAAITRMAFSCSDGGPKQVELTLVRHSCTGELEFVRTSDLSEWADRSMWEAA